MKARRDLFIVVREGDAADPENAVDRIVIDDPAIVAELGRFIARRCGFELAVDRPKGSQVVAIVHGSAREEAT